MASKFARFESSWLQRVRTVARRGVQNTHHWSGRTETLENMQCEPIRPAGLCRQLSLKPPKRAALLSCRQGEVVVGTKPLAVWNNVSRRSYPTRRVRRRLWSCVGASLARRLGSDWTSAAAGFPLSVWKRATASDLWYLSVVITRLYSPTDRNSCIAVEKWRVATYLAVQYHNWNVLKTIKNTVEKPMNARN